MMATPPLGGPSNATSGATSGLTNEHRQDKSGIFTLAPITVATGRSRVETSSAAADGPGAAAGGVSPWLWAALAAGLAGFAWLLTRR